MIPQFYFKANGHISKKSAAQTFNQDKPSSFFNPVIQPKLSINQPNDVYEQEADLMADKVMRMLSPSASNKQFFRPAISAVQRKCEHCEEEEAKLQRKRTNESAPMIDGNLNTFISVLSQRGRSLSKEERSFFEPRMGYNFGKVKVHTDAVAAKSAQSINALAYTSGDNIVFNHGQYAPDTDNGKRLLAHELTHVVQQGKNINQQSAKIQRQIPGQPIDIVDQRDGAPHAVNCGPTPGCPASFCQPFPSQNLAIQQRARLTPFLLAGIAVAVNSRVVPLWATYLSGGSPTQNLTGQFGADFASSPTTSATTQFLVESIRSRLVASPPVFPAGLNFTIIDITSLIGTEIAAINTSGDPHEMNFNFPNDIAGNLAGGIGTNQSACSAGAQPSLTNDARIAQGNIHVSRDAAGNLTVIPFINFRIIDTIDLCPGNCGTSTEQIATIPMSQFEATGISGDVPFTVDFAGSALPFTIPHP